MDTEIGWRVLPNRNEFSNGGRGNQSNWQFSLKSILSLPFHGQPSPPLSLSLLLFQNARNRVFKQQLMDRLLTETLFGSVNRCTNSIIVLLLFIICNFLPCIPIKPINRRPIAERGRFPSQVFCRAEMQWKCILKNDETRKKNYCFWRLWKC